VAVREASQCSSLPRQAITGLVTRQNFYGIPRLFCFLFAASHCRNQQPPEQPPNDFGLSDFERPFQFKLFVLLVPGGGVEPPRPCDRRILSPLRLPVPPSRPGLERAPKVSHRFWQPRHSGKRGQDLALRDMPGYPGPHRRRPISALSALSTLCPKHAFVKIVRQWRQP
jgi:hypothetical protein